MQLFQAHKILFAEALRFAGSICPELMFYWRVSGPRKEVDHVGLIAPSVLTMVAAAGVSGRMLSVTSSKKAGKQRQADFYTDR